MFVTFCFVFILVICVINKGLYIGDVLVLGLVTVGSAISINITSRFVFAVFKIPMLVMVIISIVLLLTLS